MTTAFKKHRKRRLWAVLLLFAALSVLLGQLAPKHETRFELQHLPAYSAIIGIGAGLLTVIVARLVGIFLQVPDDEAHKTRWPWYS